MSVGDDQQQFVVCRLHENNVEQCPMELPFCPEDAAKLHLTGAHSVHLTGFLDLDEDDDLRELEEMEEMDAKAAAAEAAVKPAKGKGKAAPVRCVRNLWLLVYTTAAVHTIFVFSIYTIGAPASKNRSPSGGGD